MPLKILHVEAGNNLYGGALQVLYLLQGLQGKDCINILICPENSEIGRNSEGIADQIYTIPMRGDLDIFLIWRLWKIIRLEKPSIVHLHSRRGADILGGIAARLAGSKVILTRRVDNPEAPLQVRCKYRLYDKVITISNGIYDVLISQGVSDLKLACVPSAVDSQKYDHICNESWFRKEFGLTQNVKAIGMVAQFIERKGHRYLLQAIPDVLKEYPEVKFILFGKGPLEAELKALVSESSIQSSIIFAGFRNDLERVLPCLFAIVHPAEMEGLGVALLQAAACKVPIIATNVGGIPEIVNDGVSGYIIPPRSPQAITSSIVKLLQAPEETKSMGEAARNIVKDKFSIDTMVAGNLNIYKQLVEYIN